MKKLFFTLFKILLLSGCVAPEQPGAEFNQTVKPLIGNGKNLSTNEDEPISVQYQVEKTQNETNLSVVVSAMPKNGSLDNCEYLTKEIIRCLYRPRKDFHGFDTFSFKAKNGDFYSDESAKILVQIYPIPDPPVGTKQNVIKVKENTPKTFSISEAKDVDSNQLNYEIVDLPEFGTLSDCLTIQGSRSCTYTPNEDYYGSDSFTYKVLDESALESNTVTINLKVLSFPTVGIDSSVQVNQYSYKTFEVTEGLDEDTQTGLLSYKVHIPPKNGQLKNCFKGLGVKTCEYHPNGNYYGQDEFSYKVIDNDGLVSMESASVRFTVNKVNLPPVLSGNQKVSLSQNTSKTFNITNIGTDRDSPLNLLKFQVVTSPKNGTLSNCLGDNAISCSYTPNPTFYGVDKFTYKSIDDTGLSSQGVATVEFTVNRVYQKPIAANANIGNIKQGASINFNVPQGTDYDSPLNQLKYLVVTQPKYGTLVNCLHRQNNERTCTYKANNNSTGPDSFEYKIIDERNLESNLGRIDLNVQPRIAPQVGAELEVNLKQYNQATFTVPMATDLDTNTSDLRYKITRMPEFGTLSNCFATKGDRNCTYKPTNDYHGDDSFSYEVIDEYGLSSTSKGLVIFNTAKDKAPIPGVAQSFTLNEDTVTPFTVHIASDDSTTADKLTYSIVTAPKRGKTSNCFNRLGSRDCTYEPDPNFNGDDSLSYVVIDQYGTRSEPTKISLTVIPVNDLPIAGASQNIRLSEDEIKEFEVFKGKDYETNEKDLVYTIVTEPKNGVLINCFSNAGARSCSFKPNKDFYGKDKIQYLIADQDGGKSKIVDINLDIVAVNDKPNPTATPEVQTNEDTAKSFTVLAATDAESLPSTLLYTITRLPSKGVLLNCFQGTGQTDCTFQPDPNKNGSDTFSYVVTDEQGMVSSEETVKIDIAPINDLPLIGANQTIIVKEDYSKTFLVSRAYDYETSVDDLVYKIATSPTNGTLKDCFATQGSRSCSYTPKENYNGSDQFEYYVQDADGENSQIAKVTLIVTEDNDSPNPGADQNIMTNEDTLISFTVNEGSDVETPNNMLQYSVVNSPMNGTLSDCFKTVGNRDCTYTPKQDFNGTDSFTYNISDTVGAKSSEVNVNIIVKSVNDIPTLGANTGAVTNKNRAVSFEVNPGNDVETHPADLTYKITAQPTNGTLQACFQSGNPRYCKYTPNHNWYGVETIKYKVTDGDGADSLAEGTFEITVNNVNYRPSVGSDQTINLPLPKRYQFSVNSGTDEDTDLNNLSYIIVSNPANGTLSNCFKSKGDRNCTYTPDRGYYSTPETLDSFTYKIKDDNNLESENVATITFDVPKIFLPEIVEPNHNISVLENSEITFQVPLAKDEDSFSGDLKYNIIQNPTNGTLKNCFVEKGNRFCTYKPKTGYNGSDKFIYNVTDESNQTSETNGSVYITITPAIYSGTETFIQNEKAFVDSVDIVWVVDNSGSMRDEQSDLAQNFQSFIDTFLNEGKIQIPFRMLVTTSDFQIQTSYANKLTSKEAEADPVQFKKDFQNAVKVGTYGSGYEKMLKSAYHTYTDYSAWFQGNNALTVYILLSDEPEQSKTHSAPGWLYQFQQTKDNPSKVRFYSICSRDREKRFETISKLSNGRIYNIRDSFTNILSNISGDVSFMMKSLPLNATREIIANTIRVVVDGTELQSSEWTYQNGFVNLTNEPAPGTEITITYDYTNRYIGN